MKKHCIKFFIFAALALVSLSSFAPLAFAQNVPCQSADQCPGVDVCINYDSYHKGICGKCVTDSDCVTPEGKPVKNNGGTKCSQQTGSCIFPGSNGQSGTDQGTPCSSTSECAKDYKCDIPTGGSQGYCTVVQLGGASSCQTENDCGKGQICANGACAETPAPVEIAPGPEFKPITPLLSVPIPNLDLTAFGKISKGTDNNGNDYVVLSYIAIYLAAIFRLGIGVAAVLAVVMVMAGGFVWLSAAGDAGKIDMAKKMISGAVIGLLLTLGSYTFIQMVNPDILNMQGLKVTLVKPRGADINDDYAPEDRGEVTVSGTTEFDPLFQKYAPCAGVTPDALKAIASMESGLNANIDANKNYVGLFQIGQKYFLGTDLTNPDTNVSLAAKMIRNSVNYINSHCSNPSPTDQLVMIYIAHNMGLGMLKNDTQDGCDVDKMQQASINYYLANPETAHRYAKASCLAGRATPQAYAECTAVPKFQYALKLAQKYPMEKVITNNGGACPN